MPSDMFHIHKPQILPSGYDPVIGYDNTKPIAGMVYMPFGDNGSVGIFRSCGRLISIKAGSTATRISCDGYYWTAGGVMPAANNWNNADVGDTDVMIAIATGGQTARSLDGGVTWAAGGALPVATTWQDIIALGNKTWIARTTNQAFWARSTDDGINWVSTGSSIYNTIMLEQIGGICVGVGTTNTCNVTEDTGVTTTSYTIASAGTFTMITAFKNQFFAIRSNAAFIYSSYDGKVWKEIPISLTIAGGFACANDDFMILSDTSGNMLFTNDGENFSRIGKLNVSGFPNAYVTRGILHNDVLVMALASGGSNVALINMKEFVEWSFS